MTVRYSLSFLQFVLRMLNDFSAAPVNNNAAQHQQSTYDFVTIDQQSSMINVVHLNQTTGAAENHSDSSEVDITYIDQLDTNLASTTTNSMY